MKRKILFFIFAAVLAVSAYSQGWGRERGQPRMPDQRPRQMMPRHMMPWGNPGYNNPRWMIPEERRNIRRPDTEAVTVSGELIVAQGRPAIKSGEVTYFVGGLNRLIGFVDGLKEGAQVSIEGSALSMQKEAMIKFLIPAKLTLNGKTYDMAPFRRHAPNERHPSGKQRWNYL